MAPHSPAKHAPPMAAAPHAARIARGMHLACSGRLNTLSTQCLPPPGLSHHAPPTAAWVSLEQCLLPRTPAPPGVYVCVHARVHVCARAHACIHMRGGRASKRATLGHRWALSACCRARLPPPGVKHLIKSLCAKQIRDMMEVRCVCAYVRVHTCVCV